MALILSVRLIVNQPPRVVIHIVQILDESESVSANLDKVTNRSWCFSGSSTAIRRHRTRENNYGPHKGKVTGLRSEPQQYFPHQTIPKVKEDDAFPSKI
jgi:hypothetical protein